MDKINNIMKIPVSVCITTYNIASYISQAIESVLMQKTSFPFEIVVGDDASTDNTREILLSYKEKYPEIIQLVLHEKNIGVARNDISVVEKTRGRYLAWCDGDDYWVDENKLQKQYEVLEKHQDVSLVHTDWINFVEKNNLFTERNIIQNELERTSYGKDCIEMLLIGQSTGCRYSSSMFRKEYYLNALREKPDLFLCGHVCNDFAVFISMYQYGRFYHLAIPSTVYRIRTESLSMTQNQEKRYKYLLEYYFLAITIIDLYELTDKTRDIVCRRLLNELLKFTFIQNRSELAKKIKEKANSIGYRLSFFQEILYQVSINFFLNKLLMSILGKIINYKQ